MEHQKQTLPVEAAGAALADRSDGRQEVSWHCPQWRCRARQACTRAGTLAPPSWFRNVEYADHLHIECLKDEVSSCQRYAPSALAVGPPWRHPYSRHQPCPGFLKLDIGVIERPSAGQKGRGKWQGRLRQAVWESQQAAGNAQLKPLAFVVPPPGTCRHPLPAHRVSFGDRPRMRAQ